MKERVKVVFVGTTGDLNFDVAADTGGGAAMENGAEYAVSAALGDRLVAGGFFEWASRTKAPSETPAEKKLAPPAETPAETPADEKGSTDE